MEQQVIHTQITKMDRGQKLLIRGYSFDDLIENTKNLEEVIFLLINNRLPQDDELKLLITKISKMRSLSEGLKNCMENIPISVDAITAIGIGISLLGALEYNSYKDDIEIVIRIISLIGPLSAYWYIFHTTGKRIEVNTGDNDTIVDNFMKLILQDKYLEYKKFSKPLNQVITLITDMGIPPASAHVARVTTSVGASIFSSAASGIFAFSGKYHGAAGYLCGEMVDGLQTEKEAREYVN
jgi:2-methylcitrate synthase